MARILAISSQVASGYVGLSAIVPCLQALGHLVVAVPTIVLSNHPGHRHVSCVRITPTEFDGMIDALVANRFLDGIDVVLSGYLPTEGHVASVTRVLDRLTESTSQPRYVCDPILGDHPKGLYIPEQAAYALRERLIPRADTIVPNAFELGWLSDVPIDSVVAAENAAARLAVPECIATSLPGGPKVLTTMLFKSGRSTTRFDSEWLDDVPNGTGDLLAALIAGGQSLEAAMPKLNQVIARSIGLPELGLPEAIRDWRK